MGIDTSGSVVMDAIAFPDGLNVRLSPRDSVHVEEGRVIFFQETFDGSILRYTLQTDDLAV